MRRIKIKLLLGSLIVAFLSSCVTPKDTNLLQEDVQRDYDSNATLNVDYQIIPGDRLVLNVYTLDEDLRRLFSMYTRKRAHYTNNTLNTQRTEIVRDAGGAENLNQPNVLNVYSDGTIKIPYLEKINVEGLTLLQAKNLIESKFQEFSQNITVEVTLGNRYFSMLGAIEEQRISMPTHRINIYQALALGGIIDPFGDRKKVNIIRQTPYGTDVKTFDLRSADIVNSEYFYIQPNDVIYVQELSRTFFGRFTSFSGVVGGLGIIASLAAIVVLIVKLT